MKYGFYVAYNPLVMAPLTTQEGANVCISEAINSWVYINFPNIIFN